jgi:hypothetical protein
VSGEEPRVIVADGFTFKDEAEHERYVFLREMHEGGVLIQLHVQRRWVLQPDPDGGWQRPGKAQRKRRQPQLCEVTFACLWRGGPGDGWEFEGVKSVAAQQHQPLPLEGVGA